MIYIYIYLGISQLAEALVSIKRIQEFMLYEETNVPDKSENLPESNNYTQSNESTVHKNLHDNHETIEFNDDEDNNVEEPDKANQTNILNNATLSEAAIIIRKVNAKWSKSATEYTLDNLNLHVQPGTLVVVAGPVGAGKSR